MANKARYYGVVTKEQAQKRKDASRNPVINPQELTEYSIYSAMTMIPNIDQLSAQVAANRIKDLLMKQGFTGKISVAGTTLKDNSGNSFTLTKNKESGIHIGPQEHDYTKKKK